MGLFGLFSKKPKPGAPPLVKYKSAQDIFNEAIAFGQKNFPLAYGAKEGVLADLASGALFNKYQPTSFEQALGNQYFQNVWPNTEKTIKGALSQTGLAYSPILAEQLGKAQGNVQFDIGSYLANQGYNKSIAELNAKLGIDPYSTFSPYAAGNLGQSNLQSQADYNYALGVQQNDFQNQLAKYKKQEEVAGLIASLAGGAIGGYFGGGKGALLGGSSLGTLVGGAENSPLSFSDALDLSGYGGGGGGNSLNLGNQLKSGGSFAKAPYANNAPSYSNFIKPGGAQNVFGGGGGGGGFDIGSLLALFKSGAFAVP